MRTCETAVIPTPFGSLLIEAEAEVLLDIHLKTETTDLREPATPFLQEVAHQFNTYFDNPHWPFSINLPTLGTEFQRRVWDAMCAIPPGSVKSYGALATELHSSPRAVAGACRANHFPILIPCHRVVAAHGLGGYCGATEGPYINLKRWLLRHEGHEFT